MALYENRSGGTIVLPTGRVQNGEAVEIDGDIAKMSGVTSLIKSGCLVKVEEKTRGAK